MNNREFSNSYYLNFKSEIFNISKSFPQQWTDKNHRELYDTVFYVVCGCCSIAINGHMFTVSENDIILIPKNSYIELFDVCDDFKLGFCCRFQSDFNDTELFDIIETIHQVNIEHLEHMQSILKNISIIIENDDITSKLKTNAYLVLLMAELIKCVSKEKIGDLNSDNFVSVINSYIEEHIADKISIDVLAEQTGYHPKYFIVVFKRCIGDTPARYIRKVRLERAKFLLTYTNLKISEIASVIGFSSQAKFANTFKDYTGITATEYRYISKLETD